MAPAVTSKTPEPEGLFRHAACACVHFGLRGLLLNLRLWIDGGVALALLLLGQ
jgi:hypothetical protein